MSNGATSLANGPCGGSAASPLAAEVARIVPLMLGVIGRCHDALLQEEAETLLMLRGAAHHLCRAESLPGENGEGWPSILSELESLLERVLESPEPAQPLRTLLGPAAQVAMANTSAAHGLAHPEELAAWFHRLSMTLDECHPRAVEMLRLRFSGLGSREIGARLDLPFRLVEQVLARVRGRGAGGQAGLEHAR